MLFLIGNCCTGCYLSLQCDSKLAATLWAWKLTLTQSKRTNKLAINNIQKLIFILCENRKIFYIYALLFIFVVEQFELSCPIPNWTADKLLTQGSGLALWKNSHDDAKCKIRPISHEECSHHYTQAAVTSSETMKIIYPFVCQAERVQRIRERRQRQEPLQQAELQSFLPSAD